MDELFQAGSLFEPYNKTMSKGNYRYDRADHISRIQANLKEMKEEVTEYLRKSNNDSVPPVLRARHYLILSCINKLNGNADSNSKESLKILKDLSSEKLGNARDGDRFEPLRESSSQKPEKNKIIKQKRTLIKFQNNSSPGQADCLLPNICQLKLDFEDKSIRNKIPRRSVFDGKTIELNNYSDESDSFLKERRYHSIDLNRESQLSENAEHRNSNAFRVTNKWLSASRSKELIDTLHKKNSWRDQTHEAEASPLKDTMPVINQVVDLSKERAKQVAQIGVVMSPSMIYQQRKQAMLKRRAEATLNFAKARSKKAIQTKQQAIKKSFHFEKRPQKPKLVKETIQRSCEIKNTDCSPWDESDAMQERSLSVLQGQIF